LHQNPLNTRKISKPKRHSDLVITSKPIETPDSDLAFNVSASSCTGTPGSGAGDSPAVNLVPSAQDQSSEFYECFTCHERFMLKRDYMSHHMACLLKSNTGVLFDKVKEKKEPVEVVISEEEDEWTGEKEVISKTKKKGSKSKQKSKIKPQDSTLTEESTPKKKPKKGSTSSKPIEKPDEGLKSVSRKSGRSRAPVSYEETSADLMDASVSPSAEQHSNRQSKESSDSQPNDEFELAIKPAEGKRKSNLKDDKRNSRRNSVSCVNEKPASKIEHKKMVVVTTMNTSQDEITDLDITQSSIEDYKSPSPDKMGKFFSIGKVMETPDGKFKMQLNRVQRPRDKQHRIDSSTPISNRIKDIVSDLVDSKKSSTSKNSSTSKKSSSSPAVSKNSSPIGLLPTRISRSAAKEVGVSPSKLNRMIMDSPKVEIFIS
jgi:hypothetical protein